MARPPPWARLQVAVLEADTINGLCELQKCSSGFSLTFTVLFLSPCETGFS